MIQKNQKLQKSKLSQKINNFFNSDKNKIGSKERLLSLVDNFPNKFSIPIFLIAGSWGIELISGIKLEHDDIDVIVLQNPPYYLDDAENIEESCFGIIPLETNYFKNYFKNKFYYNREFYLPSFNLQICLKIIGQLQKKFPKRAVRQLKVLLESYENFNEKNSEEELNYILKRLIPDELNYLTISKNIIFALKKYFQGEKDFAVKEFIKIHSLINKSLRCQFEKRGLTKKLKISEK